MLFHISYSYRIILYHKNNKIIGICYNKVTKPQSGILTKIVKWHKINSYIVFFKNVKYKSFTNFT